MRSRSIRTTPPATRCSRHGRSQRLRRFCRRYRHVQSTDGGDTWTGPLGLPVFNGRAIGSIPPARRPNTIYAATTRGVLGVSSVTGGTVSLIPGAAAWGLDKSTDGGENWTFLDNGAASAALCDTVDEAIAIGSPCSLRGVRRVALDPSSPDTIYAGSYSRGVWRSTDGGVTSGRDQADARQSPRRYQHAAKIALTTLPNGKTRMLHVPPIALR